MACCVNGAGGARRSDVVYADSLRHPIVVTIHIDGIGGSLDDGITAHSGESFIPFGSAPDRFDVGLAVNAGTMSERRERSQPCPL
jgi:hypothetical protein